MTNLLEEAVEELRTLPEDEQDRAAHALLAFARERHDYQLDDGPIAGQRTSPEGGANGQGGAR
jgi:hypothetical protein